MKQENNTYNNGFMRLPQVLQLIPVGKSTWWDGVDLQSYQRKFILGFGFDDFNCKLIGLGRQEGALYYVTNFGDSQKINKAIIKYCDKIERSSIEVSTKNVYDALNQDFSFI